MLTALVVENNAHPPAAGMVYVTVYGPPATDDDGVIAPVEALMLKAAGAEKTPPVVPVKVTG